MLLKVDWEPGRRKLRQFGAGLLVFGGLLAAGAWLKGKPEQALRLASAFGCLGALSLAVPKAGRLVYRAWMAAAFVIGAAVSFLILVFIYYGVLTPMGLLGRLAGRDALRLKRKDGETSHWRVLAIPEDKAYFERLF